MPTKPPIPTSPYPKSVREADERVLPDTKPDCLVRLRIRYKDGKKLTPTEAWEALQEAFAWHPAIEVFKAEVRPIEGKYGALTGILED